jgi:uncharacterized protein (TIGR03083 family)
MSGTEGEMSSGTEGGERWPRPSSSGGTVPDGEVYRSVREDLLALVADDPGAVADRLVPACPTWTVKDLYAHLSGVAADVLAGDLAGVGTDAWTEAQVSARRDRGLVEVLDEWRANGPALDEIFTDAGPSLDPRALVDAWTHQQDLRAALGQPPADDVVGRNHCVAVLLDRVDGLVDAGRVPPLRVELDGDVRLHRGDRVVLRTASHEWARGLLGRRSRRQVLAWRWRGIDPLAFVDELAVFRWSTDDQQG